MRTPFASLLSAALIAVGSTTPAVILAAAPAPAQAYPWSCNNGEIVEGPSDCPPGTGPGHALAAPVGETGKVVALPTASCIFDRWGNMVAGPACRLDASKRAACTKANGVVSTVNGAVVCTSRQSGGR